MLRAVRCSGPLRSLAHGGRCFGHVWYEYAGLSKDDATNAKKFPFNVNFFRGQSQTRGTVCGGVRRVHDNAGLAARGWRRGDGGAGLAARGCMKRLQVMQFYAMFKNALLAQRYHHAFYMEPDTWPVREQHDTTDNLRRVPDDVQCSTAQHSTAQHSTAQHSTAQHRR